MLGSTLNDEGPSSALLAHSYLGLLVDSQETRLPLEHGVFAAEDAYAIISGAVYLLINKAKLFTI